VHDDVHPPQRGPQRHVHALDVEPAGRLRRAWELAPLGVEPAPQPEGELALRQRMLAQVPRPGLEHRVTGDERAVQHAALEQDEEAGHGAVPITHDRERLRRVLPPALQQRDGVRTLVPAPDGADGARVVRACGLDRERLGAAREEGLMHHGGLSIR